jgi:hypothetical protein
MRVWGKKGITWPCIAAGGKDGAEAKVMLATVLSGRLFATRTPTQGAFGLILAMGAPGTKQIPLVWELAMPVREDDRWVGLQTDGVVRAKQ